MPTAGGFTVSCTSVRFTDREARTIDPHGYCNVEDMDGDLLCAGYVTSGPSRSGR